MKLKLKLVPGRPDLHVITFTASTLRDHVTLRRLRDLNILSSLSFRGNIVHEGSVCAMTRDKAVREERTA